MVELIVRGRVWVVRRLRMDSRDGNPMIKVAALLSPLALHVWADSHPFSLATTSEHVNVQARVVEELPLIIRVALPAARLAQGFIKY